MCVPDGIQSAAYGSHHACCRSYCRIAVAGAPGSAGIGIAKGCREAEAGIVGTGDMGWRGVNGQFGSDGAGKSERIGNDCSPG